MKAIIYSRFGPPEVLQLAEVANPTPAENQVLVKVHAASVNPVDTWRFSTKPVLLRLLQGGRSRPKNTSIGTDFAGRVEAIGTSIKMFKPGDEVFGVSKGTFAEYVCACEDRLVQKPANLSFEAAAAVPVAAVTALQALRDKGKIRDGQRVLVNGASGGVGTFAVQIAKSFGADVTAVCSTRNLDRVHSIGADRVIDYTKSDFTKNWHRYDLIIVVNGCHPILDYRRALAPNGACVVIGGCITQIFQGIVMGPLTSKIGNRKVGFMGISKTRQTDLIYVKDLLEVGKVIPVIDRHYTLSQVPEAIRYLMEGHAKGKVIIDVGNDN